jgi:Uma2 family endonuclease
MESMATVTEKRPQTTAIGEQRILIRDVGWNGYQSLLKLIGNQRVRVTYDRGDVELMSPLPKHERSKVILAQFVRILVRELKIPMIAMASTTWNREDLDRGLEADESFYLGNLERIPDPDNANLDVDPPPDLAIEVEITRGVLNRLGIYGAMGVPEIWRFDGREIQVLLRQTDGTYARSDDSLAFPGVPIQEIARFANTKEIHDETAAVDRFWDWVRQDLLPMLRHSENE